QATTDAAADRAVGRGPHVVGGIEIYKGKAILYSLGNFVFENETLLRVPSEAYEAIGLGRDAEIADFNARRSDHDRSGLPADREIWESMVVELRWSKRRVAELGPYPLTPGFGLPPSARA